MNTKNYFIVQSINGLIFGIALTFFSDYMAKQYLTDASWMNEGTKIVAKCYGTILLSFAVAFWSARNAGLSIGRRAMLIIPFLSNVALVILLPIAIFANVETSFAWVTVTISIILAVWGGLLLMKEKIIEG
jgi:hypothetical protein